MMFCERNRAAPTHSDGSRVAWILSPFRIIMCRVCCRVAALVGPVLARPALPADLARLESIGDIFAIVF